MINGKMQMRPVEFITVKKNSQTELKHGGFHIMVFNFLSPLKMGETHKLKFILENKKEIEFVAKVE
jgi:copper(I)-binding protein